MGGILGLGIAVLYELSLAEQSPWNDYFKALHSFEATDAPLFWDQHQLEWLSNTDLGRSLAQDKEYLVLFAIISQDFSTYALSLYNPT